MIILALDTAGSAASVAVARGDRLLAAERRDMRHGHAEALLPMIDAAMRAAGLDAADLHAVAVSLGPGGFTGIRVGLAAAHGIALASGARLVGISSFAAVAVALSPVSVAERAVLVALDSRRADLYVQLFGPEGAPRGDPLALLPGGLGDWIAGETADAPLLIVGDAADAAAAALGGRDATVIAADSAPDARGVWIAAARLIARGNAEGPSVRPLYLRPPDVTIAGTTPRARAPAPGRRIVPLPATAAGPLAILHRACFPDDPWDAPALARILALSGCFGCLAWEGKAPAGFVLARDLGDECEVLSIGVAPGRRRHGVGAALMAAAFAEARRRGIPSAVLEVAADNRAARALYQRLGFVRVGHRPRYYRRPDGMADALILRLRLNNDTSTT